MWRMEGRTGLLACLYWIGSKNQSGEPVPETGDRRDGQRISGKRRRKSAGSLVSPRRPQGPFKQAWRPVLPCYEGFVGGVPLVPIAIRPRPSASAGVRRLSRQQPPFHHCGRSRQIWRIGVVLILPTGGIPKHASTSPFGIT